MQSIIDVAKQWIEWDPNDGTSDVVQKLVDAGDEAGLRAILSTRLEFGTAGLRGAMGAGSNRMNDLTVLQASQGLCAYLESVMGQEELRSRGVVVGYDHRASDSLNSESFALYTAAAFVHRGVRVYLFNGIVPTPFVPFAIGLKGCAAGVMVTASHNPKQDNGYKVYWGNGSQIIPPHDAGIAACIEANAAPWARFDLGSVRASELVVDAREEVAEAYYKALVTKLCRHRADNEATPVRFTYTAMHGVGAPWTLRALREFGIPEGAVASVPEQHEPNPTFPTVPFPNPEEGKGALALAFRTAESTGATVVLANDPDADRLAVAERQEDGAWRVFTGNEIGAMLGVWQWHKWRESNPTADPSNVALIASTVSSKMLGAVARAEGFRFEETLTGFKWMGNRTEALQREGKEVLFSFEEAIGFCVGDLVRDKDGVCAAAVFAEMATQKAKEGLTLAGYLRSLQARYGFFVSNNSYCISHDPAVTDRIFARIRNEGHYWHCVGRFAIAGIRDLTKPGLDTNAGDLRPTLPVSSSHMITFSFKNGATLTLRTSGTEPKIKYYSEMAAADPETATAELGELVAAVVDEMLQPDANGLGRPKHE